jgi:hypothetical protein
MGPTYHKAKSVTLRDANLDERWLQDRILEDPSILGLGDLDAVGRERRQSSGGRIDLLFSDPENSTMYEVEVMLGRLNESHIIRSIEYWDIERRRWPDREHRAVIVAEEITNRFFNVIALLNRSVPIIAVQLDALLVDDKIVLNFTKVLDVFESPAVEEEVDAEPADRAYWERRSNPASLKVLDLCLELLKATKRQPEVSYIRSRITLSRSRQIFCSVRPMKQQAICRLSLRVGEERLQGIVEELQAAGVRAEPHKRPGRVRVSITPQEIGAHRATIEKILATAYDAVGGESE